MSVERFEKRNGKREHERTVVRAETISDYFSPERAHRGVTRGELGSILARYEDARRAKAWMRRLVRWVRGIRWRSFFDVQRTQQLATDSAIADGVRQNAVAVERPKAGD